MGELFKRRMDVSRKDVKEPENIEDVKD